MLQKARMRRSRTSSKFRIEWKMPRKTWLPVNCTTKKTNLSAGSVLGMHGARSGCGEVRKQRGACDPERIQGKREARFLLILSRSFPRRGNFSPTKKDRTVHEAKRASVCNYDRCKHENLPRSLFTPKYVRAYVRASPLMKHIFGVSR
jgi:hypothetical protein